MIYDVSTVAFSILMSLMHNSWLSVTSGRHNTSFRYSVDFTYNTFPFPPITPAQEAELEQTARNILLARAENVGWTLAELYDPDKMPDNLRAAHRANDLAVERCYRPEPFESDEERLAWLFGLYEEMIAAEEKQASLFAEQKKRKKKRRKKG